MFLDKYVETVSNWSGRGSTAGRSYRKFYLYTVKAIAQHLLFVSEEIGSQHLLHNGKSHSHFIINLWLRYAAKL